MSNILNQLSAKLIIAGVTAGMILSLMIAW